MLTSQEYELAFEDIFWSCVGIEDSLDFMREMNERLDALEDENE